ncbi:MAG: hypothetical protein LUO93_04490, partial [Methanomicrobiales archaeon]|nr:hypothetical protein [Methanomicrobiales archaeon]
MVPEAVISMLACACIGAIHSVVFGGFASPELAARITDARPKVILSASCGIEVNWVIPYKPLLDQVIMLSDAIRKASPDSKCKKISYASQQSPSTYLHYESTHIGSFGGPVSKCPSWCWGPPL